MLVILTHIANIRKMLELTKGQGHKVKGQVQICLFAKKLEKLIKNQQMDRCQ